MSRRASARHCGPLRESPRAKPAHACGKSNTRLAHQKIATTYQHSHPYGLQMVSRLPATKHAHLRSYAVAAKWNTQIPFVSDGRPPHHMNHNIFWLPVRTPYDFQTIEGCNHKPHEFSWVSDCCVKDHMNLQREMASCVSRPSCFTIYMI